MKYYTAPQVYTKLGLSRFQLDIRIERGILPQPTFVDPNGVRYFDEDWVDKAREILNNALGERASQI